MSEVLPMPGARPGAGPGEGALPAGAFETDIPARLDRLPWSRFHWLLVTALGVTWVLDGLEVTIVSAVGNALLKPTTLGLRESQLGLSHTLYLVGAIGGALVFGHLTDRLGRKKLFTLTLLIYLAGAALTACSWDFLSFALFRFVVGTAIGGEYAAINSAIDELIPARLRGRVDLAVNGTFWLGAIAGAGLSVPLLNPALVPEYLGWRIAFGLGAVVGSAHDRGPAVRAREPALAAHPRPVGRGRVDHAPTSRSTRRTLGGLPPPIGQKCRHLPGPGDRLRHDRPHAAGALPHAAPSSAWCSSRSQAFFYNGVSFSYPLVLRDYFGVADDRVGLYVLAMAVANLLGPLLLGTLFDTVGRRVMIARHLRRLRRAARPQRRCCSCAGR